MSCSTEASTSGQVDGTRLVGQSWDVWLGSRGNVTAKEEVKGVEEQSSKDTTPDAAVATLPHAKAPCYGTCPAHDDFALIQCPECGILVKPIAFLYHQSSRHKKSSLLRSPSSCESLAGLNGRDSPSVILSPDSLTQKHTFLLSPIFRDLDPFSEGGKEEHSCTLSCPPDCPFVATAASTSSPPPSSSHLSSSSYSPYKNKNIFEQMSRKIDTSKPSAANNGRKGNNNHLTMKSTTSSPQLRTNGNKSRRENNSRRNTNSLSNSAKQTLSTRETRRRMKNEETDMSTLDAEEEEDGAYVVKRSGSLTLTISKAGSNGEVDAGEGGVAPTLTKIGRSTPTKQRDRRQRKQVIELSPGDEDCRPLQHKNGSDNSTPERVIPRGIKELGNEVKQLHNSQSPTQSSRSENDKLLKNRLIKSESTVPGISCRSSSAIKEEVIVVQPWNENSAHPKPVAEATFNGRVLESGDKWRKQHGQRSRATFNRRVNGIRMAVQLALNPSGAYTHDFHTSFPATSKVFSEINRRIRIPGTEYNEEDNSINISVNGMSNPTIRPHPNSEGVRYMKSNILETTVMPPPPSLRNEKQVQQQHYVRPPNVSIQVSNRPSQAQTQPQPPSPAPSLRKLLAKSTAEVIPVSAAKKRGMELKAKRREQLLAQQRHMQQQSGATVVYHHQQQPPHLSPATPSFGSNMGPGFSPVSDPAHVHSLIPGVHTTVNINRLIDLQKHHPVNISDAADMQMLSRSDVPSGPKEIPLEPVIDVADIPPPVLPPISPPTLHPVHNFHTHSHRNEGHRVDNLRIERNNPNKNVDLEIMEECIQEMQLPLEHTPPVPTIPLHRPPSNQPPTPPLSNLPHYNSPFPQQGGQMMSGGITVDAEGNMVFQRWTPPSSAEPDYQQGKRGMSYFHTPRTKKRAKQDKFPSPSSSTAILIPAVLNTDHNNPHHMDMGVNQMGPPPLHMGSGSWQKPPRRVNNHHPPPPNYIKPNSHSRNFVTVASNNNSSLVLDSNSTKFLTVNAQTVSSNGSTTFVLPNKMQNGLVLTRQVPVSGGRTVGYGGGRSVHKNHMVLLDGNGKGVVQHPGSVSEGNSILSSGGGRVPQQHMVRIPLHAHSPTSHHPHTTSIHRNNSGRAPILGNPPPGVGPPHLVRHPSPNNNPPSSRQHFPPSLQQQIS